ncbi:hypothetical protein GCM10009646_52680 [Streptomyces aureus]
MWGSKSRIWYGFEARRHEERDPVPAQRFYRLGPCSVILSTVYTVTRRLLSLPALLLRRDVSKDSELLVLRHENAVLRRHVPRMRYEPADRLWFAALSHLIPRHRWAQVFPMTGPSP